MLIHVTYFISLLVGDYLTLGKFFKKSLLLGSIHVPLLEAGVRHYAGLVLGLDGLHAELDALPTSYDKLLAFAARLSNLPLRCSMRLGFHGTS